MIRRLILVVVLVAGGIVAAATPAQAFYNCVAGTQCGIFFYSDAAKTYEVGLHRTDCSGVMANFGNLNGYETEYVYPCPSPTPVFRPGGPTPPHGPV